MKAPALELGDIFRLHGPAYLTTFGDSLCHEQKQALRAIAVCRTAALGDRVEECDRCGYRCQSSSENHPSISVEIPPSLCVVRVSGITGSGAEQRPVRVIRDPGGADVLVEVLFQIVVAGHLVLLAAFLVQPHSAAAALDEIILHLHLEHGVDASESYRPWWQ